MSDQNVSQHILKVVSARLVDSLPTLNAIFNWSSNFQINLLFIEAASLSIVEILAYHSRTLDIDLQLKTRLRQYIPCILTEISYPDLLAASLEEEK